MEGRLVRGSASWGIEIAAIRAIIYLLDSLKSSMMHALNFFLAENVLGILSSKNSQIVEQAQSKLKNKYEVLDPIRLVATKFGVPTTRERVFFFGYLKDHINPIVAEDFLPEDAEQVCVKDALKGLPEKIDPLWIREEDGWQNIKKEVEGVFGLKLYDQIPMG